MWLRSTYRSGVGRLQSTRRSNKVSTDNFVIRQPAGQRTLALRESYLAICGGDACEAHLLNAHERWYTYKLKEREQNRGKNRSAAQGGQLTDADESLWVRMNAEGWAKDLLSLYNEKTIRIKLASLVEKSFLTTRSSPTRKWDRTPQWLFQRANVQAAVDAWEISREQPDLDPQIENGAGNDATQHPDTHSEVAPGSTRTNVRMESDKVPDQVGQMPGSSRTNVRSNNTDILTQESLTGILEQTSSTAAPPQAMTVSVQDDDGALAVAEPHIPQPTVEGNETLPLIGKTSIEMEGGEIQSKLPALEKVPGGAALLALAPIPRQVLEAREARDPLTMRALRALLFCSNKSRAGELHTRLSLPTSVKGIPRELFTRLTDDEIQQAIVAARLDVSLTTGGFERLAVLGLDHLIGEPLTLAMIKGEAESRSAPASAGMSHLPARPVAKEEAEEVPRPADTIEIGSRWEHKHTKDKVVTIVDITGGKVELHSGETFLSYMLTRDYQRVH
jgi:hypothetical protein